MRDIEFRAWLKDEKKMAKVNALNFAEKWVYLKTNKPILNGWYRFDRVELMQYTGLCDKNSKKIFENDIVKCSLIDSFNRIVESIAYVTKDKCSYKLVKISGDGLNLDDINLWIDAEEENAFIEVIGNIYQNKELLENKEVN